MTSPAESPTRQAPALYHAMRTADSLCIKCGFCLPACPTYRETGRETASPRGRLDLMYKAARGELEIGQISRHLWFCLGCLACETACPSDIRFRDMLDAGRVEDARSLSQGKSRLRRFLLERVLISPRWQRMLAWGLYLFQHSGLRWVLGGQGLLRLILPGLARLERSAPLLPAPRNWRRGIGDLLATDNGKSPAPGGRDGKSVALLTGCIMDAAFGAVHAATVKVLSLNGYSVHLPGGQACCGALHLHAGEKEGAQTLARRNIAAFEAIGDVPVIVNSAGCGALLKEYGELLEDDPQWRERAGRFSSRVRDVCEFLASIDLAEPGKEVSLRVAYDDPCHLVHAQRIRDQPRQLLQRLPGVELVPLTEADWCCGSAGSYSLTHPEMSARLLKRKIGHIKASGAQVVANGNPGCLLQLRSGAKAAGVAVRVVHPVELIAEAYQ